MGNEWQSPATLKEYRRITGGASLDLSSAYENLVVEFKEKYKTMIDEWLKIACPVKVGDFVNNINYSQDDFPFASTKYGVVLSIKACPPRLGYPDFTWVANCEHSRCYFSFNFQEYKKFLEHNNPTDIFFKKNSGM